MAGFSAPLGGWRDDDDDDDDDASLQLTMRTLTDCHSDDGRSFVMSDEEYGFEYQQHSATKLVWTLLFRSFIRIIFKSV